MDTETEPGQMAAPVLSALQRPPPLDANDPMHHEICCVNFKGLIAFLRRHYGEEGVKAATAGLMEEGYQVRDRHAPDRLVPLELQHLTDPACWVSNELSLRLFENVARIVPGPEPLRTAGAGAVRESLSRTILFVSRLLGPQKVSRQVTRLNARFNQTKTVTLAELAPDRAVFALHYRPAVRVTAHVCQWNLGIYTEVARIAGCREVRGEETACVRKGDAHCRFTITWRAAGRLRRLRSEMNRRLSSWLLRDLVEAYEEAAADRDMLIAQLSRSEEKYRTLFQDSMDAMSLTQEGRLVDVNPAWLHLHGYGSKKEILGMEVLACIHPADRAILEARRRSADQRRERIYRLRDLRRDGSTVQVEVYSSPITYGGESAILATVRDITELQRAAQKEKELEQRLQRAEKMKALATLAGGVAHDLNNILSGIVGYPDLLLTQLSEESPLRKPITLIQQSGCKAAAIVQDLLSLARREVANFEPLDVNRIVAEFIDSPEYGRLQALFPQVRFLVRLDERATPIRGSSVHMLKTLTNLVTNAAEAMPAGGTVTIVTAVRDLEIPLNGFMRIALARMRSWRSATRGSGSPHWIGSGFSNPFSLEKRWASAAAGWGWPLSGGR